MTNVERVIRNAKLVAQLKAWCPIMNISPFHPLIYMVCILFNRRKLFIWSTMRISGNDPAQTHLPLDDWHTIQCTNILYWFWVEFNIAVCETYFQLLEFSLSVTSHGQLYMQIAWLEYEKWDSLTVCSNDIVQMVLSVRAYFQKWFWLG